MKLSKTLLCKIIQLGGFLGKLLVPLFKIALPLMINVLKPLAKSALIPLEFTAAEDTGIHEKILGSTLTISKEGMEDLKIIEYKNKNK